MNFSTFSIQISMTKLTNEVVHISKLELNDGQFRVHHEVEIVKNFVSFAHVQVEIKHLQHTNQYDKIDK